MAMSTSASGKQTDASYQTDIRKIRDFAIIAHVDHGKTTLMDTLLFHDKDRELEQDRVMDSGVFERERGITITSKYTSFAYKGYTLNAVDTPGHADFGGEVERILGMVDGCLLVVDVTEGAMAQTKFVLGKALNLGLRPIVVFNKIDRPTASPERCDVVHSELFDLFAAMGACDEQLDFPVLYASGKDGWATQQYPQGKGTNMEPLLDAIVKHVPAPGGDPDAPFSMLVTMLEHDNYLGRVSTGRVATGTIKEGDRIKLLPLDDSPVEEGRVTKIMKRSGTGKVTQPAAVAGDIISLAGLSTAGIAHTICAPEVEQALQPGQVDPPTLAMVFGPNTSPIGRGTGNVVTAQKIAERLEAEASTSVSLRVHRTGGSEENIQVDARGELQLGLLIEAMRRDKFELEISAPRVLTKRINGKRFEPFEEVTAEIPADAIGFHGGAATAVNVHVLGNVYKHAATWGNNIGEVISSLQVRKGMLQDMSEMPGGNRMKLVFEVPTRGLVGFRSIFTTMTRGEGILNRAFIDYKEFAGPLDEVRKGLLISMAEGAATAYALFDLQTRGTLFVREGEAIYAGMIVGESSTEDDLEVNPTREKKLSNVRTKQADEKLVIVPPRILTLEDAMGYIQADELIEVTPTAVRLRKKILQSSERKRHRSFSDDFDP